MSANNKNDNPKSISSKGDTPKGENENLNRRHFLRGASVGAVGAGLLLEEIRAEAQNKPAAKPVAKPAAVKPTAKPTGKVAEPPPGAAPRPDDDQLKGAPVKIAVIGLGPRGRELLTSLARVGPVAQVAYICDKFTAPVHVRKSQEIVPNAQLVPDYRSILSDNSVQAVFVATPTHLHKQIVLDALAAGKHVFCETPLAHTVEDARAIAQAANGSKSVFVSGLQQRMNSQSLHVNNFVRAGTLGKLTQGRAQWHAKNKWRIAHPDDARAAELNWRLNPALSTGLVGEIGIHSIDLATLFIKAKPVAVTGFGGVLLYTDGRQVADTIQCVVEYPDSVRFLYDATLTNSFDSTYELFQGSDAAIMLRDQRGWMVKEADANQLGWEVFARKDDMIIGQPELGSGVKLATGIALVADASKQLALGKQPGEVGTDVTKTAVYQSVARFLMSCQEGKLTWAKDPSTTNASPPLVPGAEEGFVATVVAIKANEAVVKGTKVAFQPEWFNL